MAGTIFENIKFRGLAGAVPKKIMKVSDFSYKFDRETLSKFVALTGVEEFRKARIEQTTSDLGFAAAEKILSELNIDRSQVGALIFVSVSPDYIWPSTAYVLHKRLGLSESCISFDVNLGCSGFVYGVHICSSLLQSMKSKYALLITGEAYKFKDFTERESPDLTYTLLHGDACTALLLERVAERSVVRTELYSDGKGYKYLICGGSSRNFNSDNEVTRWSDGVDRSITDPYMDGMAVFSFSTIKAPEIIEAFLKEGNETKEDYDVFYFHQANKMIIERIAKKLKIDPEKVPLSLTKFGNPSSATIPITMVYQLGDLNDEKPLNILCCGFGVGLSYGVISAQISPDIVFPLIETDDYYSEGELVPI